MYRSLPFSTFSATARFFSTALYSGPQYRGSYLSVVPSKIPHVLELQLHRPSHRNALSQAAVDELEACLRAVRERLPRVLVVRSTDPRAFCAGADLKERKTMSETAACAFTLRLREALSNLATLAAPTIALVEGPARGGGAELALACDIRIVGPNASFALPEAQLGIIPGAGGTQRLSRLVGASRALEIMWSGRTVGAEEAVNIGLAQFGELGEISASQRTMQIAEQFVNSAPGAVRLVKAAVQGGIEKSLKEGLRVEWEFYEHTFGTKERAEGIAAFNEKRPARF